LISDSVNIVSYVNPDFVRLRRTDIRKVLLCIGCWLVVIGPNLLAQPSCPAAALGYAYQKTITLNHNKVSGGSDLTNFPVLINILGSQELKTVINGGHVQNAS